MGILAIFRLSKPLQQQPIQEQEKNDYAKGGKPPGTKRLSVVSSLALFLLCGEFINM